MTPDILTSAGRLFRFDAPLHNVIEIDEIAHALSHLCRFCGHTQQLYTVAQHSVEVSWIVPAHDALAGLMHDAAEAFVGDMPAPLKRLLPDYARIERQVEEAVARRFDLPLTLPESVKHADLVLLATEMRDLMPAHEGPFAWQSRGDVQPLGKRLVAWSPLMAKVAFLNRYEELTQ